MSVEDAHTHDDVFDYALFGAAKERARYLALHFTFGGYDASTPADEASREALKQKNKEAAFQALDAAMRDHVAPLTAAGLIGNPHGFWTEDGSHVGLLIPLYPRLEDPEGEAEDDEELTLKEERLAAEEVEVLKQMVKRA